MNNVTRQDGEFWVDINKQSVPVKYVSLLQKMEEKKVHAIYNLMKLSHEQLTNKKRAIVKHAEELIATYYKENKLENTQHSFTFYNFDKSLQFEVDADKRPDYDVNLIEQASQHFKAYLETMINDIDPGLKSLIEEMIMNVQRDRMNVGTVKKLEKLGSKIDHDEIRQAISLIKEAQGDGLIKVNYRIRIRNPETEKYELLDLSFQGIKV